MHKGNMLCVSGLDYEEFTHPISRNIVRMKLGWVLYVTEG